MLEKSRRTMIEEVMNMNAESGGLKPHFVLVHGVSGGSWCWYKVRCLMENSSHRVSCIDLKGAGVDQSDSHSVLSFDDYNKPLMDFMSALPENEQVLLIATAHLYLFLQLVHLFTYIVSYIVFDYK